MALRALSIPLPNGSRISFIHSLQFFLVHFAVLPVFFIPFHWYYLVACLGIFLVRMFFVTAGYHRYFSHRSFKTSRVFQFMIAFIAMTSSQKGVLWWAAHHRHHHRYSDQDLDLHSPTLFGFFWWEVDITYYTLKVLSWFGIVWDLRKVPPHLLSEQRVAA